VPKDWPEFKSWKKLKRKKLAKISVGSRWGGGGIRSGDLCNRCRVEISWEDKKGPKSPRHCALFTARAKCGWIKGFYTYEKVFCRKCYNKEMKEFLVFLAKYIIFLVAFGILLLLLLYKKYCPVLLNK
jgi:hypothetical protein